MCGYGLCGRVRDHRCVTVALLAPEQVQNLQRQELTYAGIGQTAGGPPPGYASFRKAATLARGTDLKAAAHALLTWQVQSRAGLTVLASSLTVTSDAVALMRLGFGPLALRIPCRVVYVLDEPDRQGFAYGTLPGHPESGEEAFIVQRRGNGQVEFVITGFSKPATTLVKLAGPLSRGFQNHMTERYLRALTQ
jgi:uncharacterized protein (UPF0548 family)